jgi:hypothetical protein
VCVYFSAFVVSFTSSTEQQHRGALVLSRYISSNEVTSKSIDLPACLSPPPSPSPVLCCQDFYQNNLLHFASAITLDLLASSCIRLACRHLE